MKIDRLIGILSILLQQEKVTAPYLAEKFEVSRRTISRDIEALCRAGIPVVTEQGAGGGISVMNACRLDRALLTSSELQAILEGLRNLDRLTGSSRYELLMEKLSAKHSEIPAAGRYMRIDPASHDTRRLAPRIRLFQEAIETHTPAVFRYFAPGQESERVIEPYLLVYRWQAWYVWGKCRLRGEFRLFKLARMTGAGLLPERFEPEEAPEPGDIPREVYNPDRLSLTAVFRPEVRWRLIEEFDPEQISEQPDGSLLVSFSWSDRPSLFGYLLGFGTRARLLGPPELVKEFAEHAEEIARLYREVRGGEREP